MEIKKIATSLLLSLALLFSSVLTNSSSANEPQDQATLESFQVEELDKHLEVKEFINRKGKNHLLKNENQTDEEIAKLYGLDIAEMSDLPKEIDSKTEKDIAQKYGFKKPERKVRQYDQTIFVAKKNKRSEKNGTTPEIIEPEVDGVWVITCVADNSKATLSVYDIDVDSNPIDAISGTLKKHNVNATSWYQDDSTSVNKVALKSGTFYTWYQSREAVMDWFEYDLKVTESGVTSTARNTGDIEPKRYYFVTGAYSAISALGGERHHLVSSSSLYKAGFSTSKAPTIRMVKWDHMKTPNYGNTSTAIAWRAKEVELLNAKKYTELIQIEVGGFRNNPVGEGDYNSLLDKYYDYVIDAIYQYEVYFGIR